MKQKVMFINPNFQSKIRSISQITVGPPLGMAYLAAVLEKDNFNVKILDANAYGLNINNVLFNVKKFNPDIIGLSAVTPTIYTVHDLILKIKKSLPNVKIIIGGVHASTLPEDTLKRFPSFDVVVLNEAESIISKLCNHLLSGTRLDNVQGIGYRTKQGNVKVNKNNTFIKNLDKIPFPARHLLPMHMYRSVVSDKFTTMIAMRGCYANCKNY